MICWFRLLTILTYLVSFSLFSLCFSFSSLKPSMKSRSCYIEDVRTQMVLDKLGLVDGLEAITFRSCGKYSFAFFSQIVL